MKKFATPFLLKLVSLPLFSLTLSCQNSQGNRLSSQAEVEGRIETIHCTFALDAQGEMAQFKSILQSSLGKDPQTLSLKNEKKPGKTNLNPRPEEADRFIRAASGVRLLREPTGSYQLLIAQDSRRKIGLGRLPADFAARADEPFELEISMLPIASAGEIAKFEDEQRDYESYRKTYKLDFEAVTTLPGGELLFLGSGSDLDKLQAGEASYRSEARLLSETGTPLEEFNLSAFYLHLNSMKDLVGEASKAGAPLTNFEGVAVRPAGEGHVIAFFHRGNWNGNGHNAMIEYDFSRWLNMLRRTQDMSLEAAEKAWQSLAFHRLVKLQLPRVASAADPSGATFPITLNDALYGSSRGKSTFFIPVGAEAEYKDAQGVQHDGEVTFAGLARWQGVGDGEIGRCEIFQAPGDPAPGQVSLYGKVEGLAAYNAEAKDPFERSLYTDSALVVGVTDVDSEIRASRVSVLKLSP